MFLFMRPIAFVTPFIASAIACWDLIVEIFNETALKIDYVHVTKLLLF